MFCHWSYTLCLIEIDIRINRRILKKTKPQKVYFLFAKQNDNKIL